MAGSLAQWVAAAPSAGLHDVKRGAQAASIADKAHGFHCRKVLGWDPVAGVYRYHSHPGICRNYRHCLREQKRCIFVLGNGFQRWSYEAFGYDNERFTACMIRSGCY